MEDLNTVYTSETILQLKPEMQPFLGRKKAKKLLRLFLSAFYQL